MNIQEKAFHIIYDIIGVVIRWDKNQLSDKEAMNNIVDILASHAEDEEENEIKIIKKLNFFKSQKKLLAPLAISVIFFGVLFGTGNLNQFFTNTDVQVPINQNKPGFEQLSESTSNVTEQIINKSSIEDFSNLTNIKQD